MATRNTIQGHAVRADKNGPIVFLASTPREARDGLVIPVEAWDTRSYELNPVVQWSHAYDTLPIARTTRLERSSEGLIATLQFNPHHPDSDRIEKSVRDGYVNSVSVGFKIHDQRGNRVTKAELLEISLVPIPSDTGAVALSRSAYQRTRRRWSEQSVCAAIGWKVPTASERELAVAMARFLNGGSMSGRHD